MSSFVPGTILIFIYVYLYKYNPQDSFDIPIKYIRELKFREENYLFKSLYISVEAGK